ncbi:hypothetical protein J3R30DRAFT_3713853 [Lentinula aciculospora]|uniref:Ras-domain-containing protein n=1 Tax=Lentinula aciculospora TaxID=153920 RepID=A0A9W8ZWY8_9AGAR|nr:hypothetical protein J3R30DRAFT_3713853 [Lentinula aciculospora]
MTIPQRTIKLVVIGAAGVGKTSMRGQFISQRFSTGYRATIGADFITKVVKVDEDTGEMATLQIWDTAGQERFSSLSSAFFRGADAALLVFDVNAPDTLQALIKWWEQFKVHAPLEDDELGSFCCVVVGNKVDLSERRASRVSFEQAGVFMDTLVPPELYRDEEEEDSEEEEDDPLSASQMTATPTRPIVEQIHQPFSLSPLPSTFQSRSKSPSKSIDPGLLTRSLYASSSTSGLSIYHTPSSSVYGRSDSARSSPDLLTTSGSYPPKPLPPLIIGSIGSTGSLGSLRAGNTSAVTLTPSNWDKFDSSHSDRRNAQDDEDDRWSQRDSPRGLNGDSRSRYESINSIASSTSATDSFFSAYSTHTRSSKPSSSRSLSRPFSALSWRPYPHSPSPAPPLKSPSHSQHSHSHNHDNKHLLSTRSISPSPASSSSTSRDNITPHLRILAHPYPHSHLRSEMEEKLETPEEILDTGPRLFFASARTGEGVNDVFEYVAKRVVRRWEWEERSVQRRSEEGEDEDEDGDEDYVVPGGRRTTGVRAGMSRINRKKQQKQHPDGMNRNGNTLNGVNGFVNGVGSNGARSWSGDLTVTLSSFNGVVGSSMGSMRGTGGSNCCSA